MRILDAGYTGLHTNQITVNHYNKDTIRVKGTYAYHSPRNALWVGIRNYPFWRACLFTIRLWWIDGTKALTRGEILHFIKGWFVGIRHIPDIIKIRKPLSPETVKTIVDLQGFC